MAEAGAIKPQMQPITNLEELLNRTLSYIEIRGLGEFTPEVMQLASVIQVSNGTRARSR